MPSYYSLETVPVHLVVYAVVVAWSYIGGSVPLWHAVLFGSIFFNHIVFEAGATVRLDYLVIGSAMLFQVGTWRAARPIAFWWLAGLLSVLLLASLVVGVAPGYSIRKLTIVGIYIVGAAVLLAPPSHGRPMMEILRDFLAVGNRVLAVSLALYLVVLVTGWDVGFMKERDQSWLRGPMINPNVFGSTSATLLLLNAAIALRSDGRYWAHAAWTLVSAACVFLSYTRAAWILAVPFTLLVVFWWVLGSGRLRLGHLLLMTAFLASALSFGPIAGALRFEDKLGSLVEISSGTAVDRIVIAGQGLQDWLGNPLFGTGFQTYEFLAGADQDPTIPVPGVLFVQLLQYGGTGALLCFLAFLWVLHRRAAYALRRSAGWLSDDVLVPLILAIDLLVAAYQVTSAIFIAYFWFLAMLVAYLIEERLSAAPASTTLNELPAMATAPR